MQTSAARPVNAAPRRAFELQEWSRAFGGTGLLAPVVAALVVRNGSGREAAGPDAIPVREG
jgi:hypothetical protein